MSTLHAAPTAAAPCHLIERQQLSLRVRELPALPRAALDALAALRDDDTRSDRCAELIGRDQALAARTLRLANSAFYGVPGRVGSIRDAVHLIGRRPLGSMITLATVARQFKADSCPMFSFGGFWRHAIAVALCSRGVALELGHDGDQAFTLGLLHDIGRLALAAHFPLQMQAALQRLRQADTNATEFEREVMGTDHAEVGALVARQWSFPADIVHAIACHHAPTPAVGGGPSPTDIAHVANAMAHALDLAGDPDEQVPSMANDAWDRVALSPRAVLQIFHDTESGVTELCQSMDL